MADGIAGGPATAAMRAQPQNNGLLGALLHWAFPHNPFTHPGEQAAATGNELVQMFNPTSRAGIANILSSFVGGPKGDELLPNPGMPGHYEPYSISQAAAGGHLSHDQIPAMILHAIKTGQGKDVHDVLFGGEVHARGEIPHRPDTTYTTVPPRNTHEVIQSIAQRNHAPREQVIARALHNHGFEQNVNKVFGKILGFRSNPTGAGHYAHGEESNFVTPHEVHNHPEVLHQLTGGHPLESNAARTAALVRLLHQHGLGPHARN